MTREIPLLMPKMSMTMESGELLAWLKNEGEEVTAGDPIVEVQTDKVNMEVESPVTGTLVRTVAGPGDVLDVGVPMAFISTESDDLMEGLFDPVGPDPTPAEAPTPAEPSAEIAGAATASAAVEHAGAVATPPSRRGPLPAVPRARRRAAELRVALEDVDATGTNGVITLEDVERAAGRTATRVEQQPATTPAATTPPAAPPTPPAVAPAARAEQPAPDGGATDPGFADALAPRRRAIRGAVARTMTASATIPQFTIFAELDLDALDRVRGRISWTTLLLRGLARSLRRHPQVNAGWDAEAGAPAAPHDRVGIALAVDSAVGLLAPVVKDPDTLPVAEQDALVRATIDRARKGSLSASDMQGATSTLSNLGGFGVPSFTSLLTPPQATALSVGAIAQRPVVIGGGIAVRLGTTVGLTVDHRPIDGADGARLLGDLQQLFRNPDELLA